MIWSTGCNGGNHVLHIILNTESKWGFMLVQLGYLSSLETQKLFGVDGSIGGALNRGCHPNLGECSPSSGTTQNIQQESRPKSNLETVANLTGDVPRLSISNQSELELVYKIISIYFRCKKLITASKHGSSKQNRVDTTHFMFFICTKLTPSILFFNVITINFFTVSHSNPNQIHACFLDVKDNFINAEEVQILLQGTVYSNSLMTVISSKLKLKTSPTSSTVLLTFSLRGTQNEK